MKGVLVIDMPSTCYDCPLAMRQYKTLATSNKYVKNTFACVLTHKNITSTKRSRFCPLKEMPQKKSHGEDEWEDNIVCGRIDGWNACIEEIEK